MFTKQVLLPYVTGFSLTAFALPQDYFVKAAFQFYHLQELWMLGKPMYLEEIPDVEQEN